MIEVYSETDLYNIIKNDPRIIIIMFEADYCTSCNLLKPKLMDLEKRYSNKLLLISINANRGNLILQHYFVDQLPTIIFYQNQYQFKQYRLVGPTLDTIETVINIILTRYSKKVNNLKAVKPTNPEDIYTLQDRLNRWK